MFNFNVFLIMKNKNSKFATTLVSESGTPIYYAPAASTSGNGVKIYRYAFEKLCMEYKRQIDEAESPIRQAILRHEWARFIRENIGSYSGSRRFMRELAKYLEKESVVGLRHEFRRINMDIHSAKNSHRITDLWLYEQRLSEMTAMCPASLLEQMLDKRNAWVA
jgi:hypothetical protein